MNHPMHIDTTRALSLHEALYRRLMRNAAGDVNDHFIAQMLAGWLAGKGALPRHLGIGEAAFTALCERHFPGIGRLENGARPQLVSERETERADLRALMLADRAGRSDSELVIAELVAIGCMAEDHLWSDLGLRSRPDVSALLAINFPALAARNDKNMKWKKFFYKQLCAKEGIYLCRAPSCAVCADYRKCFIEGE
jgi:nitrogen fixation protein NifQ